MESKRRRQRAASALCVNVLLPLLTIFGLAHPASALEVKLGSAPAKNTLVQAVIKELGRSFESRHRPTLWGVTNDLKTKVLRTAVTVGSHRLAHPLQLNCDLSIKPQLGHSKLQAERSLDLSLTKSLSQPKNSKLELGLSETNERSGSLLIVWKFSF
jgi:hypothetical protein